jgi:nitroreductase
MGSKTIRELIEERFGIESKVVGTLEGRVGSTTLSTILSHRTHRRFTSEAVDEDVLDTLLACGLSAPSKSDLQQASVIVVRDSQKRRSIADLVPSMPWIGEAPVFLVVCADHRRIRRVCDIRGRHFANDNLDGFMNAAVDAALVLQTFSIAAEAVGLGCCAISVIRDHIETVSRILCLPEGVFPLAGLCVGHPSRDGYKSLRLPPAVTVHVDAYDDSALQAELDEYDRRRDAVFSIPAERQKYTEEYGEADFYGWSEDKARQESHAERPCFRSFLEEHGFSLL